VQAVGGSAGADRAHAPQVDELMIPRAAAESALAADGGDVAKTLQRLVVPPPNWPQ
jgi:hypothetical protein